MCREAHRREPEDAEHEQRHRGCGQSPVAEEPAPVEGGEVRQHVERRAAPPAVSAQMKIAPASTRSTSVSANSVDARVV